MCFPKVCRQKSGELKIYSAVQSLGDHCGGALSFKRADAVRRRGRLRHKQPRVGEAILATDGQNQYRGSATMAIFYIYFKRGC